MASYSIITYGFGDYGTVYLVPTYGFHIGIDVTLLPPVIDIEVNCYLVRSINFNSVLNTLRSFNGDILRSIEFRGDL